MLCFLKNHLFLIVFQKYSMGDKIGSKKLASKAGVSVIPGFMGEVEKKEVLCEASGRVCDFNNCFTLFVGYSASCKRDWLSRLVF
jgi:hypothetical protein